MTDFPARLVLQSMHAPMLLIGPDQRVSIQNAAMTDLLNLDFTGRNYVAALRQPAIIEAVDSARADQAQKTARYIIRSDGIDQTFAVTVVPESGHLLLVFEDQTAAQVTHALRRDFVANVSHELRTPVSYTHLTLPTILRV